MQVGHAWGRQQERERGSPVQRSDVEDQTAAAATPQGAGRVGHPQAANELEELLACLRGPQLSAFAFLQLKHHLQSPPGTAACCSDLRISK